MRPAIVFSLQLLAITISAHQGSVTASPIKLPSGDNSILPIQENTSGAGALNLLSQGQPVKVKVEKRGFTFWRKASPSSRPKLTKEEREEQLWNEISDKFEEVQAKAAELVEGHKRILLNKDNMEGVDPEAKLEDIEMHRSFVSDYLKVRHNPLLRQVRRMRRRNPKNWKYAKEADEAIKRSEFIISSFKELKVVVPEYV